MLQRGADGAGGGGGGGCAWGSSSIDACGSSDAGSGSLRASDSRLEARCGAAARSGGVSNGSEAGGGCESVAVRLAALEGLYAAVSAWAGHLPQVDLALLEDLREAAQGAVHV